LATSQLMVRNTAGVAEDDERMLAVAPIRYRSEKMGFLIVYDENPQRTLSQHEGQTLMAMAGHAAIATSNSRLFEEVHQLATTDGLTGLYNRRHFLEVAEQTFQFAKHHQHPLAMMLLDVDLFKQINDRHGHTTGDEVLRGIATLLEANLPEEGMVGRYGGEEFVVLLPQTSLQEALEVAEHLRRRVATTIFPTAKGPVTTTISLGVAEIDPALPSFLALLDQADAALYQAKAEGRNRVVPIAAAGQ
jgi:diguanylate cyclase (GGDEF)-like protein